MQTDYGRIGAKVQSWSDKNPRHLLKKLIEGGDYADSDAGKRMILDDFYREIGVTFDDNPYLDAIIEYWFTNNFASLQVVVEGRTNESFEKKRAYRQKTAEVSKKIAKKIEKVIEKRAIFFLNTALPHGKTLGKSTFKEIGGMGEFLSHISGYGNDDQLVEEVFSDQALKELQE